ncbi:MAG: hypothetical protein Roseis3KO_33450 [Roseivirga sp.]
MIKFFRKIRQDLLIKNKTGTYLKYAVGEIVLVVIGIMIALSINDWSTYNKERKLEQTLLISLKAEFERNLIELERDNALNIASQAATLEFLQEDRVTYSTTKTDSLWGVAFNYAVFDARTGTFDETIASGNLRLIRDEGLKALLGQWTGELHDLRDDVINRREHFVHSMSIVFRQFIPMRNIDRFNYREDYDRALVIKPIKMPKSSYTKFYNSLEVDGVLYEMYLNQTFVTVNEESLISFIKEVIKSLEQNINK